MNADSALPEDRTYPIDLILVILLVIIGALAVLLLPDGHALRLVLGLPLLLFFPGYALVSTLWPENIGLSLTERSAISIGLSIMIVAVIGVFTSFSIGLSLSNVLAGLVLVTFLFSGASYYRRSALATQKMFRLDEIRASLSPANSREKAMALAISGALIASGCVLAYMLVVPATPLEYTEFYLLDNAGTAVDYPLNVTVNETASFILGISCQEGSVTNYLITTRVGNTTQGHFEDDWSSTHTFSPNATFVRNITVQPDGYFEDAFSFRFTAPGVHRMITTLHIDGSDTYFDLHLWIHVNSS